MNMTHTPYGKDAGAGMQVKEAHVKTTSVHGHVLQGTSKDTYGVRDDVGGQAHVHVQIEKPKFIDMRCKRQRKKCMNHGSATSDRKHQVDRNERPATSPAAVIACVIIMVQSIARLQQHALPGAAHRAAGCSVGIHGCMEDRPPLVGCSSTPRWQQQSNRYRRNRGGMPAVSPPDHLLLAVAVALL